MPHEPEVPGLSQQITRLTDITHTVECRLLQLIAEGAEKTVPLENFSTELELLAKEVTRCYRQVADIRERRDVGFEAGAGLEKLVPHCVWLYRRIRLEQCFFRKWHLETELRSRVSAEAFDVYQKIADVEAREREYVTRDDDEIRRMMADKIPSTL